VSLYQGPSEWKRELPLIGPEGNWIFVYLMGGLWLTWGIFFLSAYLTKRDALSTRACIVIAVIVYLAQVGSYTWLKGFHWMLLVTPAVVMGWLIRSKKIIHLNLSGKEKCTACGEETLFTLSSEQPNREGESFHYCRQHFKQALHESFKSYRGRLILVSAPEPIEKPGQFFFYQFDEMALDSYSESDSQSFKTLFNRIFHENDLLPDDSQVARISAEFVQPIGSLNQSEPLLKAPAHTIQYELMNGPELEAYLDRILHTCELSKFAMQMNLPYAEEGVYLWSPL
jgi:hypothetical protein